MYAKILSPIMLIVFSLTLASCGSTSYSDFDSTPDTWRGPSGETPHAFQESKKGKIKKLTAEDFAERARERFDRF